MMKNNMMNLHLSVATRRPISPIEAELFKGNADTKELLYRFAYLPLLLSDIAFGCVGRANTLYNFRHKEKQIYSRITDRVRAFDSNFFFLMRKELPTYDLSRHQEIVEEFSDFLHDDLIRMKLHFRKKFVNAGHDNEDVLSELLTANCLLAIIEKIYGDNDNYLGAISALNSSLIELISSRSVVCVKIMDESIEPFIKVIGVKISKFNIKGIYGCQKE